MLLGMLPMGAQIATMLYGKTGEEEAAEDETEEKETETKEEDTEEEDEEEDKIDMRSRKQVRAARAAEKSAKRQLAEAQRKLTETEKKYKSEKLTEVEQLKQLLEESQRQKEEAIAEAKKTALGNRILSMALKEGFTDPDDVVAYITHHKIDEEDIEEAILELKEDKPYLLSTYSKKVEEEESEDSPGKTVGRGGARKVVRRTKLEGRVEDNKKRAELKAKYDEAKRRGDSQTMRIIWSQAEKLVPKEQRLGNKRVGLFEYEEPLDEA